jgi:hypothetical protein
MAAVDSTPDPAAPGGGPVRLHSWHNRIFNALGMLGGAVIAATVALLAGAWWLRAFAGLVTLALLAWAVRGLLVGVVCTQEQVVVRELTRTHRIPWGDVLGVTTRVDPRFKLAAPALIVYADEARHDRRGGRLSAMSLAAKHRPVVDGRVRTLTEQWEAHVADSAR